MKTYYLLLFLFLLPFNISEGNNLLTEKFYKSKSKSESLLYRQKLNDLDQYYSSKRLGSFVEEGKTIFRLFTPSATNVKVLIFNSPGDKDAMEYNMERDKDAVWEAVVNEELYGKFYGYKVYHNKETDASDKPLCVDPYAKAVATYNTYANPRLSIVVEDKPFDWEGTSWIQRDWRDLIIYEMHIKDMTAHPSAGALNPGTYKGLVEKNIRGGINYIKELGVNTVELLPAQEFGNCEIPYLDSMLGRRNTWNPYERNHWGYMTAAFFAPESYYSDGGDFTWKTWSGTSGQQINDFKEMVKGFHKEGIGVIMDVVYNHLSEYEIGNLKEIDREYYFRLDDKGNFISESFCGNDLKTERPMVRRLIVESLIYWMKEYQIDGFRFDLGKLIDWETIETIIRETRKVNPNVVIVCEPWGGGYDPQGFSLRDWGSWNDQIRNGIKGENPYNGLGWIFSKWYGNNNPSRIKSYVNGTLVADEHGLFQKTRHSVNYLESHDGYTISDFIRIGLKDVDNNQIIKDVDSHLPLNDVQLKLNKLAALFLFTSQGMTMIHSGQEFARSKVIPYNIDVEDSHRGKIDHNSYEKDNETNYINYNHVSINQDLYDYYKGLISLRSEYEAFRRAEYENVAFFNITDNDFAIGFKLDYSMDQFIVLMNADMNNAEEFILPDGNWNVLINPDKAGVEIISSVNGKLIVPPSSGFVLKKN
jgi:pullulanase